MRRQRKKEHYYVADKGDMSESDLEGVEDMTLRG